MSSKRQEYEKLLNNKNVVATLHTIASVEVTDMSAKGYSKLVGGTYITLQKDHPRQLVVNMNSDACGRYQFLSTTWDGAVSELGALDFSNPRHQDLACIYLINIRGVLKEVLDGDIIGACTGGHDPSLKHETSDVCYREKSGLGCEWAGLYPNRYGQNSHDMDLFIENFNKYKDLPLPGEGNAATEDTTSFTGESSSSSIGSISGGIEYGASSITGFIGEAVREILPNSIRIIKTLAGNPPKSVSKVMGGKGQLAGYVTGMSSTDKTSGSLKTGEFTPKPGAHINPLPTGQLTSPIGWRWGRMHSGVDISTRGDHEPGDPVLASADGTVIDVQDGCVVGDGGCGGGYGNLVIIDHPDGISTLYGHLAIDTVKVSIGQKVKQGDVIAIEGSTGGSTATHLHFEMWKGGYRNELLDPLDYIPEIQ